MPPKKSTKAKAKSKKNTKGPDDEFELSEEEQLLQKLLQRVQDHVPDTEPAPNKKRKTEDASPAPPTEPVSSAANASTSPKAVVSHAWHPAETTVLEFLITGCLPVTQYRLDVKAQSGQYKGVLRSRVLSYIFLLNILFCLFAHF